MIFLRRLNTTHFAHFKVLFYEKMQFGESVALKIVMKMIPFSCFSAQSGHIFQLVLSPSGYWEYSNVEYGE